MDNAPAAAVLWRPAAPCVRFRAATFTWGYLFWKFWQLHSGILVPTLKITQFVGIPYGIFVPLPMLFTDMLYNLVTQAFKICHPELVPWQGNIATIFAFFMSSPALANEIEADASFWISGPCRRHPGIGACANYNKVEKQQQFGGRQGSLEPQNINE